MASTDKKYIIGPDGKKYSKDGLKTIYYKKRNVLDSKGKPLDRSNEYKVKGKLTSRAIREILDDISLGVPKTDVAKKYKINRAEVYYLLYKFRPDLIKKRTKGVGQ